VDGIRGYVARFGGFERDARMFLGTALVAGAALSLYWIDFNLYLASIGLTPATIGLIATAGSIASTLVAFPASALSDRIGRRLVLAGGLAMMLVALLGFLLVRDPLAIGALAAVYGAGQQVFFVIQNPFLMEHSRAEHRSELFAVAFAIENVTNIVAAVAGGAIAVLVARWRGFDPEGPEAYRVLLVLMCGLMALAMVAIFLVSADRPRRRAVPRSPRAAGEPAEFPVDPYRLRVGRRFGLAVRDRTTFVRLLVPGFLISLGAGQVIPFLNLFVERKFALDLAALNALFAVTALGTVFAILLQPALAGRLGKIGSVVLVQGVSIPFLVVLGFSPVLWTVIAAMAVRNSLMNAGNPIFNAFAMERVGPLERATLSAAMSVLWSLGWVIAGLWYSLLQAVLGFELGYAIDFVTIIVLYSTATVLLWAWFGRDERAARAARPAPAD
jgi:MFS family permease